MMKVLQTASAATLTANRGMQPCATRSAFLQSIILAFLALAILVSARPAAADFWANEGVIRSALEKNNYAAEVTPLLGWFDFEFSETKFQLEDIRIQAHSPAPDPSVTGQPYIRGSNTGYTNKNQVHVTIGIIYFFLNTNRSIDELSVLEKNGTLTVSYQDKNVAKEQDKPKNKSSFLKKDTVYPIFAFSLNF